MKSPKFRSDRATLLALARRCQVVDRRRATGLCLTASLELALAARSRGIALTLVRWTVRGDADFRDHWAVRLDARHVLDLTRVQVDRRPALVSDIDDYPAGYVDRRFYPAALFLHDYAVARQRDRGTLPAGFMLAMARRMFRHDMLEAARGFFPVRAALLAADCLGAHLRLLRVAMTNGLERRRDRLVRRLGYR